MRRFPTTLSLILLAPAACAERNGAPIPDFEVVDSASVRIAINSAEAVRRAPRLGLREDLRLGAVDGSEAEAFVGIGDVAVDDEGRIFVADGAARMVRVFAEGGESLGTFGRPGEGPGEFRFEILRMAVAADTVLLLDRDRLHLFTTDGEFVHSVAQSVAGNEVVPTLARGGDAWFVGRSVMARPADPSRRVTRDTFRIRRIHTRGGSAGPALLEVPAGRRWFLDDGYRSWPEYLAPEPAAAVGPGGEVWVTDGRSYDVSVYSSAGDLRRRIRVVLDPPPLAPVESTTAAERWMAYYDSVGPAFQPLRDAVARASSTFGPTEVRPIPGRLLVAPDGRVLLERRDLDPDPFPRARSDSTVWDAFGPDGRIEGRLVLPPNAGPELHTGRRLYTIERDDLGVQYVVRYDIVVPGDGEPEEP